MRLATWNVNSLNVRLDHLLGWVKDAPVDLLALQETKLTDDKFPSAALERAGFHCLFAGQKTYNGVALLSRSPMSDTETALPGVEGEQKDQKRLLAATIDGVRVVNVYVPNGQSVGSDKYHDKLRWLAALRDYLAAALKQYPRLVVLGDFNIAPEDRDVHDPMLWEGNVLVSPAERQAFRELLALPLIDSLRQLDPAPGRFSWWDYRAGSFRRNLGVRIDHVLASPEQAARLLCCSVDPAPRGWERPSDHAPVVAEFSE